MLEKPDLQDQLIIARLQEEYRLQVNQLTFLPLGVDVNTAVFRVVSEDESIYFLKLRKGGFEDVVVAIPQFISEVLTSQGIRAIIAPIKTSAGRLYGSLDTYTMVLYPFIEGQDGYEVTLTDQQWLDFGATLKAVHSAQLPAALARLIPRETYSPRWRQMVKTFQSQVEETTFEEPTAARLAAFMRARKEEIDHIVERAEMLGRELQSQSLEQVLCHSDIHPGNLLICPNGAFYIVDWDNPILAPKERDLLLIGGCFTWNSPDDEALFYQGYSPGYSPGYNQGREQVEVDRMALAYYRYERIIQDIAEFCEQLLSTTEGGEDREQGYFYFTSNFLPGHEIDIALQTDASSGWL